MFKPYFVRTLTQPLSQIRMLFLNGTSELPIGHEIQVWHFGEGGPCLVVEDLRGLMFIDDQSFDFGALAGWAIDEAMGDTPDDDEVLEQDDRYDYDRYY